MLPLLTRRTTVVAVASAASGLVIFGGLRSGTSEASHLTTIARQFARKMSTHETTGALAADAQVTLRPWYERGHAQYPGFLRTFHTFSFSSYYDEKHTNFSDLRVINEDRVTAGSGFPTHPHSNAEIFSYIVSGELTHKDSMGNVEVLKRGDLQFTCGGTGIRHSEYNDNKEKDVHFLQIWYTPDRRGLTPQYYTSQTDDAAKTDKLVTLIKPMKTFSEQEQAVKGLLPRGRAIPANNSIVTRASILTPGKSVTHTVGEDTDVADKSGLERWMFVQLVSSSGYKAPREKGKTLPDEASLTTKTAKGETKLAEGDGAYIKNVKVGEAVEFTSTGGKPAEL